MVAYEKGEDNRNRPEVVEIKTLKGSFKKVFPGGIIVLLITAKLS